MIKACAISLILTGFVNSETLFYEPFYLGQTHDRWISPHQVTNQKKFRFEAGNLYEDKEKEYGLYANVKNSQLAISTRLETPI